MPPKPNSKATSSRGASSIAAINKLAGLSDKEWAEALALFETRFRTEDAVYPRPARLQMLLEKPDTWPGMLDRFVLCWTTHKLLR